MSARQINLVVEPVEAEARAPPWPSRTACAEASLILSGSYEAHRQSPSTIQHPLQARHQKQGPLLSTGFTPASSDTTAPSDSRCIHVSLRDVRVAIPTRRDLPCRRIDPSSDMPSPLPRWTGRVHASITFTVRWSLPRVRGGSASTSHVFEACSTFTRYGLPDRSTAQGGLCHEASTRQLPTDSRSSASEPNRHRLVWSLPPTGSMIVHRTHPNLRCLVIHRRRSIDAFARRHRQAVAAQRLLERGQTPQHVLAAADIAHGADAPDPAVQRPERGADLDAEVGEHLGAQLVGVAQSPSG